MSEWRLILETSGRIGNVGLARGNELIHAAKLDENCRHARDLMATVQRFLTAESLRVGDLGAILVGIGPGGYTGLRVGLTTAKVLAYASGVPLIAVPTFNAVAQQAPPEAVRLWVIADALQGTLYFQRFETNDGFREPTEPLQIVSAGEWLPWANKELWLMGPGVAVYGNQLPCDARVVDPLACEPQLEGMLRAAERLTPLGREELFRIEPLYLRGSSAEEKAKRDDLANRGAGVT
ncbi:tRNA (adenosine(37)-N6)-threonylcarbamoyltransferase complex dimerization subunit type 1 TsaB [Limnoglobus roseus]|uniref:tRNA (Adenosine(37)-N6)-threonylcarbamoyltransferase complex dimerization subunit type 1 TsaB n=1 Tax=Limnoglobus roseus TaxID=2598579 RepID=A0A5C1AK22_9BACT|nr:tRNA (adenosine(37)-N6)-threonylcarbamoyltransferase complex dimerization subunit type 1 TsaB [Limnoglobus roseus]QEL18042.1 tRNA (adenosine(37)-N6)-threonylcarbamoyltransferase complex dimerization subunit type 1 TsaB [Limnoglobus roseus]